MPILDNAERCELERLRTLNKGIFALSSAERRRLEKLEKYFQLEGHLQALELAPESFTFPCITKSYHRLALINHPDKNQEQPAAIRMARSERFKALNNAKEWLAEKNREFVQDYIAARHLHRERLLPKRGEYQTPAPTDDGIFAWFNFHSSTSGPESTPKQRAGFKSNSQPTYQQPLFVIRLYDSSWAQKKYDFKVHKEDTPKQLSELIVKTFKNRPLSKVEIRMGQIPLEYKKAIILAALELKCTKLELPETFIDKAFCKPLVRLIDNDLQNNSSHSLELITNGKSIKFTLLPQKYKRGVYQGIGEVNIENLYSLPTGVPDLFLSALVDCPYLCKVIVPSYFFLPLNLREAITRNLSKLYYIAILKSDGSKSIFWGSQPEEFEHDNLSIQPLLSVRSNTIQVESLNLRALPPHLKQSFLSNMLKKKEDLQFAGEGVNIELCTDFIQHVTQLDGIRISRSTNTKKFTLQWETSSISFTYHINKQGNASLKEVRINGYEFYKHEQQLLLQLKTCPHLTSIESSRTALSWEVEHELEQFAEKNKKRKAKEKSVKKLTPINYIQTWRRLGYIVGLSMCCYLGLAWGPTLFYSLISGIGASLFASARKRYVEKMSENLREDSDWENLSSTETPREKIDALKCGEAAARSTLAYFKHFTNKNTYTYYAAYCAGLNIGLKNDKNSIRKIRTL